MTAIELGCAAVLFDSDGVLVDSERSVELSWRRVAEEFGLDVDRLFAELAGVRAVDTLRRHLDGRRLEAAVARLEDLEVETSDRVEPIPGARQLTDALAPATWAVATSATRRLAEVRWRAAGIDVRAPTVTADDVARGKPDPDPFLRCAELLEVDPRRCVVLEDSPSGGEAARAAGAVVVAVGSTPWAFEPAARVPDLTAVSAAPVGRAAAEGDADVELVLRIG